MARTAGAKNVIAWPQRSAVPTTDSTEIKHLASVSSETPLDELKSTISHQKSYLNWIDSRHKELSKAKKALDPGAKGPKDATYRKYRWYAEQQALFEAINAFEVFFKKTFIALGTAIRQYVPAENIKGSVDARVLWAMRGRASVPALILEHQLFHDLEQIDKTSQMLVEARRYNVSNPSKGMKETVKALQALFQIRHTLAHNQGYVTNSDAAKFGFSGYSVRKFEVIDLQKDQCAEAIRRFIVEEARAYTDWIVDCTADYLTKQSKQSGFDLRKATGDRIESRIGSTAKLQKVSWA